MMLVEQIISNNEHLARAFINRLNAYTIPMVPGACLDTCQKLPPDIADIIYNIMKTCMVERFKLHMQILEST
jgi:hypothetical protein